MCLFYYSLLEKIATIVCIVLFPLFLCFEGCSIVLFALVFFIVGEGCLFSSALPALFFPVGEDCSIML